MDACFTLIEEVGDIRTIRQFKTMEDYAEWLKIDGCKVVDEPKMSDSAPLESGQWYMCNMGAETRPVLHHGSGYWSFDRNNGAAGMIENLIPLYKMIKA